MNGVEVIIEVMILVIATTMVGTMMNTHVPDREVNVIMTCSVETLVFLKQGTETSKIIRKTIPLTKVGTHVSVESMQIHLLVITCPNKDALMALEVKNRVPFGKIPMKTQKSDHWNNNPIVATTLNRHIPRDAIVKLLGYSTNFLSYEINLNSSNRDENTHSSKPQCVEFYVKKTIVIIGDHHDRSRQKTKYSVSILIKLLQTTLLYQAKSVMKNGRRLKRPY